MTNKNIYDKIATHHTEMAQEHQRMHKFTQDKHTAMDDTDEHKSYFMKAAAHHEACAKMHGDHAKFMQAAAQATPIDGHGAAGEDLKILTSEDLIKSFTGGEDAAAPAFTTTALAPARGGPEFTAPHSAPLEELPGWTD